MDIGLDAVREVVIDNVLNVLDIDASGSDIGGDEDSNFTSSEIF
jgi:hypothetical protein